VAYGCCTIERQKRDKKASKQAQPIDFIVFGIAFKMQDKPKPENVKNPTLPTQCTLSILKTIHIEIY
jgi:hypothetical protein